MIALQVMVQIKAENLSEYLEAICHDAEHSEKDESGCLRFDVLQDKEDPCRFYYYEVYRDEGALEAHRQTPHFKLYAEKVQAWLAAPPERRLGKNIIPSDADWR
jgi:quinol monooxygenase YgiN